MDETDKGLLMTMIGVSGLMFLLVPAHPGCPGQNPESHKTAVCVCAGCPSSRSTNSIKALKANCS